MQQEHGPRARGQGATERRHGGGWTAREKGEPHLEELLDDPMMTLLWRRDRLEPSLARAAVRLLQTLVRDGDRRGAPVQGTGSPALAALGLPR